MAKQKFTRESAQAYLAGNPNFTPAKPFSEYKTPYLKRMAASYQKAEQAGVKPSRAAARGHAEVRHIPKKEGVYKAGRGQQRPPRPEQYSIGTSARKATPTDMNALVNYAQKPPKARKGQPERAPMRAKGGFVSGNITGILAQDYSATKLAGDLVTLSFRVHLNDLNAIIASGGSAVDIANALMGQSYPTVNAVFSEVHSFNVLS
jgi:hypothetical protein